MLQEISRHLRERINNFSPEDNLVFNNKITAINKNNFEEINPSASQRSIAFVDGGQAEILSAGNFCLSFIRVGAVVFENNKKVKDQTLDLTDSGEIRIVKKAMEGNQGVLLLNRTGEGCIYRVGTVVNFAKAKDLGDETMRLTIAEERRAVVTANFRKDNWLYAKVKIIDEESST